MSKENGIKIDDVVVRDGYPLVYILNSDKCYELFRDLLTKFGDDPETIPKSAYDYETTYAKLGGGLAEWIINQKRKEWYDK